MKVESISYAVNGAEFQSELVYDDTARSPRPLLVMAPNWAGVTPKAVAIGEDLAAQGYAVLVADMHGLAARLQIIQTRRTFLSVRCRARLAAARLAGLLSIASRPDHSIKSGAEATAAANCMTPCERLNDSFTLTAFSLLLVVQISVTVPVK